MIDIHTHLIPGIDDGCGSREETRKVCEIMRTQGVDGIVATPHFYADSSDPETFLSARDAAYESIADLAEEYHIIRGAEVRYFSGIGMAEGIEKLCIEGTRLLLLEPAEKRANSCVTDDLMKLRSRNLLPVIAHLNRYDDFYNDRFISFCNVNSIPIQLNTECLFSIFARRRALNLIRTERVQFLATDCHDSERRKPNLGDAMKIVRRYLGDEITGDFIGNEERMIYERL